MGRDPADSANGFTIDLFSPLATRYDLLCEVLSMGQNRRWRRCMVDHVIGEEPSRVLDVASGTAGVAVQLARRSPARVTAYDLTLPMLRHGAPRGSPAPDSQAASTSSRVGPKSSPSPTRPSTR